MSAATTTAPRWRLFGNRPDPILVCGRAVRARLVQQTGWSFAAANVGAFIISALYYMLTQWHWHIGSVRLFYLKPGWDGLFKTAWWPVARHDVRDVYESVLATLFVKSLLANWRKNRGERVGAFRIATAPLVIIGAALPIVAAGIWVINFGAPWLWHRWLHHHVIHWHAALPGWLATYLTTWNWQPVVIGVLAGLVVHRLYRPVGATVQAVFVERSVVRYKARVKAWAKRPARPGWRHSGVEAAARDAVLRGPDAGKPQYPAWVRYPLAPPVVRELFCELADDPIRAKHGVALTIAVPVMTAVALGLAVYGGYVKFVIAAATKTSAH